ncbi:MAG: arylamine N-acetyltransferase [Cytophagales bacterium]|nr:arylamine N-acetyltransferase [Cytophagales bacterium]
MKNLNHFQTRPKVAPLDVKAYLEKLGVLKELPSLNYLRELQKKHLLTIPFENLDIHFRRAITIDIRKIFDKIIPESRGGFCYELNFLFYHLLIHLGYDCHLISARVMNSQTREFGAEYDHMAVLVKIQTDLYLCDVGFGDGFVYPKKLEETTLQMDLNRYFQFLVDPDGNCFLKKTSDTLHFDPVYQFTTKYREPIEFIDMCDFHQSSPKSHFTGKKMITILTEEGRITLTDKKLKIVEKGEVLEMDVLNEDDFYSKMEEHFGISYQMLLQN